MTQRKFEIISTFKNKNVLLPERKTIKSAGYDFYCPEKLEIKPFCITKASTGIKVLMPKNEVLFMHIRSSLALKQIVLFNSVGVIDADYYNNPKNEGHIMLLFYNFSKETVIIEKNERFAQGIFCQYQTIANEQITALRTGGFGSTNHQKNK